MEPETSDELRALLESQRLAVLSTHDKGAPYASLVAFASTPDVRHLIFATSRSTRKYRNLSDDGRAAMLIDNRSNMESDFHTAAAVTATGTARELEGPERDEFGTIYTGRHPYLCDFLASPTCALFRLTVDTCYLVTRFQHVVEIHVNP
ncbi:MAG: pyridoxamine 5'-phosphate oxidase family protein [Phycisphaerae bacterium]|nr:pyridoxamine 5'-phosphate oxidase family protein [Phycisphaerae bacterium]